MLRSFYAGISGLRNHQQAMDVVGNNLANVNTTAYKASRTTFMDTLSQTIQGSRTGSGTQGGKNPMQVGLGMTIAAIDRDTSQGALQSTGRNLDMAIEGEGWFVVGDTSSDVNNYFYTRVGNFFIDDKANLVTAGGDFVYGWVDTDSSGSVDPTRDDMKFINLDRRKDGAITNTLASTTPPISGPNSGDASIKKVSTTPTTVTDTWRVENVNAELGIFRVSGARNGTIGTFGYADQIADSKIGSFSIDMGPPAQAALSVPYTAKDGLNETLHLDGTGAGYVSPLTFNFTAAAANGGVTVTRVGDDVRVTMNLDANGVVDSTYEDVVTALNGAGIAGFTATLDTTSTAGARATALVNQIQPVSVGAVTDMNLGDVGPVGVLTWEATETGGGGNNLNIQMLNRGAQQKTTEVFVDGSDITIYLRANTSGEVVATADEVYDAFNANVDAVKLATMTDPTASGTGAMVVESFNPIYFKGGSGANLGDYFTFTTTAPGGAKLQSVSVNREGGIIGVFENGATEEIARVAVARVPNPQGLLADGQGKFSESPVSGTGFPPVVAGTSGTGGIASGFLEMSNVDLTREFTEMIVDQRGFQANSRIITTSDEMLQELMQIKR